MEEYVIKEIKSDAEELYQEYLRYQNGDKFALDRIFIEKSDKIQDYINKYYSCLTGREFMDNVLDAEFIKAEMYDEQEKHSAKVQFRYDCLNQIMHNAKREYSKKYVNTSCDGGTYRKSGYKKFYEGEYDVSDIQEIMTEIIIMIFQGKLKSNTPIGDSVSLLKNIKYHLVKEIGQANKNIYKNIPELKYIVDCDGIETSYSYFDKIAEENWIKSQGEIDRLLVYADFLKWIIKNDIHQLFKEDADDIHAIIEGILNHTYMFKSESQEGLSKATYQNLQKYILQTTGRNILDNNISKDLKIIEQSLLNHLMYALNYEIGKAEKSNGFFKKESERVLKEVKPKRFFKLFGRERMNIYNLCEEYLRVKRRYPCEVFLSMLRGYDDIVLSVLSKEKGKKKYDMVNLLTHNYDVVEEDDNIVSDNIANVLINYYRRIEEEYISSFLDQYNIVDRFVNGRSKYWQANYNEKMERLSVKFFSSEDIKNPVRIKIKKKDLILYEGYGNYYVCDLNKECSYRVPKDRRIIHKSDKRHKLFCYKIA